MIYLDRRNIVKIHMSTRKPVTAASGIGTTWYRVTLKQFKDYFEDKEDNLFVKYTAVTNQFDCLDLSQMFGSAVYDDELFICVTDGQPLLIGTDTEVDPETAFDYYTPEELHAYIEDASQDILLQHLTYREILPKLLLDEQSEAAISALESKDYNVKDIIEDYNEIW